MNTTYKYEDWLDGKVILSTYDKTRIKNTNYPIADLSHFDEIDQVKIQSEQLHLLEKDKQNSLSALMDTFDRRRKNSQQSRILYDRELEDIERLLYTDVDGNNLTMRNWNKSFSVVEKESIREVIDQVIICGIAPLFRHVLSKKTRGSDKPYFVSYALSLYHYHIWLKRSFFPDAIQKAFLERDKLNPHPGILKNYDVFVLLYTFKDLCVNSKTELADYSFIYGKLRDNHLFAKNVSHIDFITLVRKAFNANISENQTQLFPKNQTRHKEPFDKLLRNYYTIRNPEATL